MDKWTETWWGYWAWAWKAEGKSSTLIGDQMLLNDKEDQWEDGKENDFAGR